ncbi:hypothetical protein P8452_13114 [Trifolium repens]|nr:hypothetical protein P8452_13114 [Trifolium repens]
MQDNEPLMKALSKLIYLNNPDMVFIDAYSVAAIKAGSFSLPGARAGGYGGQIILPLDHTIEHEEIFETGNACDESPIQISSCWKPRKLNIHPLLMNFQVWFLMRRFDQPQKYKSFISR